MIAQTGHPINRSGQAWAGASFPGRDAANSPPMDCDEERVPRPVVAAERNIAMKRFERAAHTHRKAQLVLTTRGTVSCEAEGGLWIVPQHSALWIPGGVEHAIRTTGLTQMYFLFVDREVAMTLPSVCSTVTVSPLFRELLIHTAKLPSLYDISGPDGRLVAVVLDQLKAAPVEQLHLPMPSHPKLRRIAEAMVEDPSERVTIAEWGRRVCASERTLTRILLRETGMSFGRWRRQLHLIIALDRLRRGASVQEVSLDLGYESASAFITMFKKTLGKPPARYLADRQQDPVIAA